MGEWIAVITITLLACISPGPDFAMVSRNSVLISRRAGLLTALGIGGGVLLHVAYTLGGIGLLLHQSPALFDAVRLVGAAWLVWLGVSMLRSTPGPLAEPPRLTSDLAALRRGFLTNALNPKTTVFILSLFLQVTGPETPFSRQIGYGLFISAAHVLWFALVALLLSAPRIQTRLLGARVWIDRVFGLLLIGFGLLLGLSDAP